MVGTAINHHGTLIDRRFWEHACSQKKYSKGDIVIRSWRTAFDFGAWPNTVVVPQRDDYALGKIVHTGLGEAGSSGRKVNRSVGERNREC
jgi:hypothetical protein